MAFLKSLPARPVLPRPVNRAREKRESPEFPKKTETGKTGNGAPAGIDRFTRTGEAPYTRKDGTQTTLATWQGLCRQCGKPFEVTTPLPGTDGFTRTKAFGRVRCDAHKQQRAQP